MADPVIIPNRPFWARIFTVFWAVEVVAGLTFAATGVSWLGERENGVAGVLIVLGLVLAVAGVVMTGVSWRVASLKAPAIEMTTEGLLDRRISPVRIPWDSIDWAVIFNGRSYSLQFDVRQPMRAEFPIYWEQRAMGRFNRLFKYPELTMVTLGTGLSAHALGKYLSAFKPPKN